MHEQEDAIAIIRTHAAEFMDKLRKIDRKILVDLVIVTHPDGPASGFQLAIKEDLPLSPKPEPHPKPPPFKDAPFRDTPWHDHARPPSPRERQIE